MPQSLVSGVPDVCPAHPIHVRGRIQGHFGGRNKMTGQGVIFGHFLTPKAFKTKKRPPKQPLKCFSKTSAKRPQKRPPYNDRFSACG